jgi:hypothetical protein
MKFNIKTKKFNLNDIKTFEDIYKDVKNNYIILRDINDLI